MRQKSLHGIVFLATALVLGLAGRPSWSAEKVPSDRLLPPNVYAYLSIPNVPEFKTRWKQTLLGKLGEEKSLSDFWSDVDKQIDKLSEELENNAGVKIDDLTALPAGELAIAVIQPQGKAIGVVAIMDFGKNEATVDKLLERGAKAADEHGAKKSEKDIDGTKVVIFSAPKEDAGDTENDKDKGAEKVGASDRQVAYFLRDSYIVVGSDLPAIEAVLARWDGKHAQTFAENKTYAYILEHSRSGNSTPVLTWYLNPLDLIKAAITSNPDTAQGAAMVLGFLPALGVNNFKGVGGSLDLATEDYDSVSRTLMYVEQPTSGILNIFQFPATEQTPPSWVTDDATSYFAFNWNVGGAYDAVEALVDTFQGPGAFGAMIDGMAGQDGVPKVHLKKDLVDQISGQMHVTSDTPSADDPAKQRYLFAIDIKDEAKMKSVLETVSKTPGFPGEAREFHGQTIYEAEIPLGGETSKFGVCVANGHLLIATDVTRIDQIILADKDRKPLAQSENYKKISKVFPAKTSMLSYQRQDTQVRALYDMLRTGPLAQQLEGVEIDFKKLPPFEAIQKYLPATGSYAVPDKNGVLFVNFSLKSAK